MISFLLAISVSTQLLAQNDVSYPNEKKGKYADLVAKQKAQKEAEKQATPAPVPQAQPEPEKKAAPVPNKIPKQAYKGSVARTIFSNVNDAKRAIIVFNKRPSLLKAYKQGNSIIFKLSGIAYYNPPPVPKSFKSSFVRVKRLSAEGQPLLIEVQSYAGKKLRYSSNANMLMVDVIKEPDEKAKKPKGIITDEKNPPAEKVAEPEKPTGMVANFSKDANGERLVFPFKDDVPAAIFNRFGYIWFVFKTTNLTSLPTEFKGSEFIASSAKIQHEYQVMKLELKKEAAAKVYKNKTEWTVQISSGKPENEGMLKLSDTANSYTIETAEAGLSSVELKDDLTGDDLLVVPLSVVGQFVVSKKQKPEFEFLDTYQGLVFKPYGKLNSSSEKGILTIKKNVAGVPAVKSPQEAAKKYEPIYEFSPPLKLSPQAFQATDKRLKNADLYEYGRFLFNQGLYMETAAALREVSGAKAKFMYAASSLMSGRPKEAVTAFNEIVLPESVDPNEIMMWKVAADKELAKIAPHESTDLSLDNFEFPTNFANYPPTIKEKIIFALTEKLTEQGSHTTAQDFLKMIQDEDLNSEGVDRKNYLQALIFDSGENRARAYELWTALSKNIDNREIRAKSAYGLISQDYSMGRIKIDEAIKRMQDIRAVWRGDAFEYKLLMRIAELMAINEQEIDSLGVYREILNNFPKFPKNLLISAKMREIFERAMDKGLSDKAKTFQAVTAFYEFEELKPIGEKGNEIMLKLSDNLARFDLIQDSVRILEKYLNDVNDKKIKAETGTKIAILNLLNRKPKEALDVLARTESDGIAPELLNQRKELAVKSLIDLNEYDKAQSLFKFLPAEKATRFSTDIMWKKKDWNKLIYSYSVLPEKSDEDIMRMAVAFVMLGNNRELQNLRGEYSERMAKTLYKDNFQFITDNDKVDYRDLANSLDLDQAGRVLDEYKKKISAGELSTVTPVEAVKPEETKTPAKEKDAGVNKKNTPEVNTIN